MVRMKRSRARQSFLDAEEQQQQQYTRPEELLGQSGGGGSGGSYKTNIVETLSLNSGFNQINENGNNSNNNDATSANAVAETGVCFNVTSLLNSPLAGQLPGFVNERLESSGPLDIWQEIGRIRLGITSRTSPVLQHIHFVDAKLCLPRINVVADADIAISGVTTHVVMPSASASSSFGLVGQTKNQDRATEKYKETDGSNDNATKDNNNNSTKLQSCANGVCKHRRVLIVPEHNQDINANQQSNGGQKEIQNLGTMHIHARVYISFIMYRPFLRPLRVKFERLHVETDHPCFTYLASMFEPLIIEALNSQQSYGLK